MRLALLLLVASLPLAGCSAFGDLTTGAMTTTDRAVGAPTPPPPSH